MLRDPPEIASRPIGGLRPTGWEALIYMISLTKPQEQMLCFGICFDGIDTFDHRI